MRTGKFNNYGSPNDRWKRIKKEQNIEVKPWRFSGNDILIVLQKKGDSTLNSLYEYWPDYGKWVYAISAMMHDLYPDMNIVIRPHLKSTQD